MEFYIVDAFIDPAVPFSGNPAAVVPGDDAVASLSDETKQMIAQEFNLSETVFVHPVERQPDHSIRWSIRWFTPLNEVKLCGHATVAASHVLFATERSQGAVKYRSRFHQENLEANRTDDGAIVLDFPCNDCHAVQDAPWLPAIKSAIVGVKNTGKIVAAEFSESAQKLLLRLADDTDQRFLLDISPDHQLLLRLDTSDRVRGVIVTQKSDFRRDGIHFRSRYFAPWYGVPEDPVTGSAHTVLTPFWSRVFQREHQETVESFHARQVSKRTGKLECQLTSDGQRVLIKGRARIFCHGTMNVNKI